VAWELTQARSRFALANEAERGIGRAEKKEEEEEVQWDSAMEVAAKEAEEIFGEGKAGPTPGKYRILLELELVLTLSHRDWRCW